MTVSKDAMTKLLAVVEASRHVEDFGQALAFVAYISAHRKHLSPAQWRKLKIAALGIAGLKDQVTSRVTGTTVSIYETWFEPCAPSADGESARWTVVCETHGTLVTVGSLVMARHSMSHPYAFCDECREILTVPSV